LYDTINLTKSLGDDLKKPPYVDIIEKSYSPSYPKFFENTHYVVINDYRIERSIPDEVHVLLTRVLNIYLVNYNINRELRDIIQELRDEIVAYNDVIPCFKLFHVLLIIAFNFGENSRRIIINLFRDIMNTTRIYELKTFIKSMLDSIRLFNLQIKKRYLLFFVKSLNNQPIIILDKYSGKRVFEGITSDHGEINAYLLPYLKYIAFTKNKSRLFKLTNTTINLVF